jgi:hypothetical protein
MSATLPSAINRPIKYIGAREQRAVISTIRRVSETRGPHELRDVVELFDQVVLGQVHVNELGVQASSVGEHQQLFEGSVHGMLASSVELASRCCLTVRPKRATFR